MWLCPLTPPPRSTLYAGLKELVTVPAAGRLLDAPWLLPPLQLEQAVAALPCCTLLAASLPLDVVLNGSNLEQPGRWRARRLRQGSPPPPLPTRKSGRSSSKESYEIDLVLPSRNLHWLV